MAESKQLEYGKWAIFIAVLLVLWTILKKFGVVGEKTTEEKQEEEATELNLNIDFKDWTNPNFLTKNPPSGYQIALFTMSVTDQIVNGIYDSHGIFNDNEEMMLANLKKIKYKTQYSWVAKRFEQIHGEDMTAWLKNYFSEAELYPAWKYLSSIPTYAKK